MTQFSSSFLKIVKRTQGQETRNFSNSSFLVIFVTDCRSGMHFSKISSMSFKADISFNFLIRLWKTINIMSFILVKTSRSNQPNTAGVALKGILAKGLKFLKSIFIIAKKQDKTSVIFFSDFLQHLWHFFYWIKPMMRKPNLSIGVIMRTPVCIEQNYSDKMFLTSKRKILIC